VKLTAIAAAIAIVTVPIAVQGAPEPTKSKASTRRICTVQTTIGSRLNNTRRCRTRAETEAEKQEIRQVIDKVQNLKVTMCPPIC